MKRAKYVGPHAEGVWVDLNKHIDKGGHVHVKQGGLLPTETDDGRAIPAALRDELLGRDDWTAQEQSTTKKEG